MKEHSLQQRQVFQYLKRDQRALFRLVKKIRAGEAALTTVNGQLVIDSSRPRPMRHGFDLEDAVRAYGQQGKVRLRSPDQDSPGN